MSERPEWIERSPRGSGGPAVSGAVGLPRRENLVARAKVALLAAAVLGAVATGARPSVAPGEFHRLPLAFVENRGQWDPALRFVADRGALGIGLAQDAILLRLVGGQGGADAKGVVLRLTFEGASASVPLRAGGRLPGVHHFYLDPDPRRWVVDLPGHASVRWEGLYPGVDLLAREEEGRLEYDLLLAPGADLERVRVRCEGMEEVRIDAEGSLLFETGLGPVRQRAPLTWEEGSDGRRRPLPARWRLLEERTVVFEVAGRDPSARLVVDPGIEWSALLGGTGPDAVNALALEPSGGVALALASSYDFLPTPGAFNPFDLGVQVARLDPSGSVLVYAASFGAGLARAIAVDASGSVTLAASGGTGWATTPGAYDTTANGQGDAVVVRLNPQGNSVLYGSFLGGSQVDMPQAIAVDPSGEFAVAGWTHSPNFPVTAGALDTTFDGGPPGFPFEGFVSRWNAGGSALLFSTFLGAEGIDEVRGLGSDGGGLVVAGVTSSPDFPTTPGALQSAIGGLSDGFVARLLPTGAGLAYSTFLGGEGNDACTALALDAAGSAAVTGQVGGTDFPLTPGAFDTSYAGGGCEEGDAFVARLDPAGAGLAYSTLLGAGSWQDRGNAIALDVTGSATVAGWTGSPDFPTTAGAHDTTANLGNCNNPAPSWDVGGDAFVARLDPTGGALLYSTFLGDTGEDLATSVAVGASGSATVAGQTTTLGFPTTPGAAGTAFHFPCQCCTTYCPDVFVTRLDMLPAGASRFGASTGGCLGPLAIGVDSIPQAGNAGFAATCAAAPPGGSGWLVISGGALGSPVSVSGASRWVDLGGFILLPALAAPSGFALAPLPLPPLPGLAGFQVYLQFFWIDACAPGGFSASNALALTVQP